MDPVAMTFAAVGWLMSALVSKVVTALLEAWAKRIGLGNEFKTLKKQLLQLGALLTCAHQLGTGNSSLKDLVHDLQQLAYQAENLLDELDYYRLEDEIQQRGTQEKVNFSNKPSVTSSSSGFRLASRSILSTFKGMSCSNVPDVVVPVPKTFSARINLSRRMTELAEQLQKSEANVRKAVNTEALVIAACKTEIIQAERTNLPQTSSFITEPTVFGRDQERDQLMNLLTNEESAIVGKVPVVAIVGSGGVGKTTLARLVFNDPEIRSYFVVTIWICVSTRFDSIRLTREMLEGACGKRYDEFNNLNELQNKLKYGLESKRFLLVLDDMWEDENKSQWDSIVSPLNYCRVKGSKILVTTRNESVAKMVGARNISLHGLDEKAFTSLFNTSIFNDPNYGGNSRFRKIGQEIANKLNGNPLAAKTVSALLREKLDERYWMKIRDSEEWKSQSGPDDIMPALRLSYEHLPFHLQRCFSYCAIFPKDNPFTCMELVYLWMAQGFLDIRSECKRMEDIGSAYFNDLYNRGFFQTIQSTSGGKVFFTFHDFIHELACMVSSKECLTINGSKHRQVLPTIRHLSIFSSWTTKKTEHEEAIVRALSCLEGENLSTILLINWHELPSGIFQSIPDLLKETKFLRAVRLNQCFWVQPKNFNFQNFVSLRYLRLIMSFNICKTLPKDVCRLYHLEVFELKAGSFLDKLPNNFSDLVSLRHFVVEGDLHSKIEGVGKLTSLQELNYFNVQQKIGFEIEQLGSLTEIGGSLQMRNLENVKSKEEASKARLADKEELDDLYLQWNHGGQDNASVLEGLKPSTNLKSLNIVGYGGVTSPTWLEPSLIFLESLTLEDCEAWECLPPIGDLEFLKHLKLSGLPVREIGLQCYGTNQSMKFSSLEELQIINMPCLEKWVWSDQLQQFLCFKNLKDLTIQNCTKLVDLPLSGRATSVLERFPSLVNLKISDCPLIFQLPPLPYSSLLSFISIEKTESNEYSMLCMQKRQKLGLILDKYSLLNVGELLAFHELSSLRFLEISNITCLRSLDLHSPVALEYLIVRGCQSLTSLIFGDHLVRLTTLKVISCKKLCSMKGLHSWVNLKCLHFSDCPGFIAGWDSALKEIQSTEPNFSLSLTIIEGDSLALLTLPIYKQLTSLQIFDFEFSAFTEENEISSQLLTSLELVNIRGSKNLQSFPFDIFPSLKELRINFPQIQSLSTNNHSEITEECLKLRNIKEVHIDRLPVKVIL